MAQATVDKDWEAEDDARTLSRSSEIRNDTKRYERAMKCLKKQHQAAMDAVSLEQRVKKGLKGAFSKKEMY